MPTNNWISLTYCLLPMVTADSETLHLKRELLENSTELRPCDKYQQWMSTEDSDQGNAAEENVIEILGLFDKVAYHGYGEEIFNFTMSLINDHDDGWHDDLFDDDTFIRWHIRDSACDASTAMRGYWDFRLNYLGFPPHGVVGARCSSATVASASLTSLEGVPQVSPDATTHELSDVDEFPFFSRLVSSGEVSALVTMLRGFGWQKIGIIMTEKSYTNDIASRFQQQWTGPHNDESGEWHGEIAYTYSVLFNNDMTVNEDSIRKAFDSIPTENPVMNTRIILVLAHKEHAFPILRIAKEINFQPDTIFVGVGWANEKPEGKKTKSHDGNDMETTWFDEVPGYIGISPYRSRNQDYYDFLDRINEARRSNGKEQWTDIPDYPGEYLVDSILALAMGLSRTAPENRRNGTAIMEQILGLDFGGITGRVGFTKEGNRKDPQWTIFNHQDGKWVDVGYAMMEPGSASIDLGAVCFAQFGCGLNKAPSDTYPIPQAKLRVWVIPVISIVAIMFVATLLRYHIIKNKKKKIQSQMTEMQKKIQAMKNIDNALGDVGQALDDARQQQADLIKQRAAMQETPETWSDSLKILVPVPPENGQYWAVLNKMRETLPNAHISMLWRIQNSSLWSFYSFHKDRLENNKISANERRVWHGTSTLDPAVIYNDQMDGFMMQFAAKGLWGRGIYFADKASYSKNYSHNPAQSSALASSTERPKAENGELEMFLTRLLVGKEAKMSQNGSLTVPPVDPRTGLKYNTVTGETNGSQVWIVYENGRAYPEYLVRYYCGDRDDKRSPYKSISDARNKSTWNESTFDLKSESTLSDDSLSNKRKGQWEYKSNLGWVAYDAPHQDMIEKTYLDFTNNVSPSAVIMIQGPEWKYEINVDTMTQTNTEHPSHTKRMIRFYTL